MRSRDKSESLFLLLITILILSLIYFVFYDISKWVILGVLYFVLLLLSFRSSCLYRQFKRNKNTSVITQIIKDK